MRLKTQKRNTPLSRKINFETEKNFARHLMTTMYGFCTSDWAPCEMARVQLPPAPPVLDKLRRPISIGDSAALVRYTELSDAQIVEVVPRQPAAMSRVIARGRSGDLLVLLAADVIVIQGAAADASTSASD
jgi:hypothetical protein